MQGNNPDHHFTKEELEMISNSVLLSSNNQNIRDALVSIASSEVAIQTTPRNYMLIGYKELKSWYSCDIFQEEWIDNSRQRGIISKYRRGICLELNRRRDLGLDL
jgi:hypothetical protein